MRLLTRILSGIAFLGAANGAWVVGLLLVVTLTTAVPLAATYASLPAQRAITWLIALLLLGFSVLAGFTVGLFFLPSALVLLLTAILTLLIRKNDSPDEGRIQRSAW